MVQAVNEGGSGEQGEGVGPAGLVEPGEAELSAAQRRALVLLGEGRPLQEVAQQVGVHRTTLYRWSRRDAAFRAQRNAWEMDLRESCRAALIKSGMDAVACIAESARFNTDVAWKLIKELKLFDQAHTLSIDPGRVQREIEAEEIEVEDALEMRSRGSGMSDLLHRMLTQQGSPVK